eukprot:CAMPEP_0119542642 /NCGR_PEP_ID=MMETSP1344-20130328/53696_1 /TAXON_ID=236787 /ORGANISM="Florenciella parvula, Strain CCMP2471" /LENGTH=56 /DNA_ID=CAMNT_0007586881 /DNA_START=17 /DNA_END=187 /DNA_ORIENTATION=+
MERIRTWPPKSQKMTLQVPTSILPTGEAARCPKVITLEFGAILFAAAAAAAAAAVA